MVNSLLVSIISVLNVFTIGHCYTCETPEKWLERASRIAPTNSESGVSSENLASANIRRGEKWPDGTVPYKFHHSLTLRDIPEVRSAFEEYESKTCIRFQPWKEENLDYVSIEVNQSVCGVAHVCKQGGYQFAQFGDSHESCRNQATMIHELGHTICLGHEHQRSDRDDYLHFFNCTRKPRKQRGENWTSSGIYDYSSQFHYECNWCDGGWPTTEAVTKCGSEARSGLSPLDVDKINELYDCQGCHRHRWRPANSLTDQDKTNMYNFGYVLKDGTPLYPCRAPFRWEVSPGRFDIQTKSCHITHGSQTRVITDGVEVLTIPNGLNDECSVYKLRNRAEVTKKNGVVSSLSFRHTEAIGYVAYGSLATENALGKVWLHDNTRNFNNSKAELQVGSVTEFLGDYKVLTCSLDETCLLKKSCDSYKRSAGVSTSSVPVTRGRTRKVVCYFFNYVMERNFLPDDVDPQLCTHLIYYTTGLSVNNSIKVENPFLDLKDENGIGKGGYQRFIDLKKRNSGVKTLIAIGSRWQHTDKYIQMAENATARRIFVDSIIPFMETYGFDGLDLHEMIAASTHPKNIENFSTLVNELRHALNRAGKGYLLTATLRQTLRTGGFASVIPKLGRDLDFINVIGVLFNNDDGRSSVTSHASTLYRHPNDMNHESFSNIDDMVTYWLQAGLPKEKLIMEVWFSGTKYTLARAEDHGLYAPTTRNYGYRINYNTEEDDQWRIAYNKYVKAPYAYNGHSWIGYEDVESIYYKALYVNNKNIGGASVWSLDWDDYKGDCHNESYILLKTLFTTLNCHWLKIPQRPVVVPEY